MEINYLGSSCSPETNSTLYSECVTGKGGCDLLISIQLYRTLMRPDDWQRSTLAVLLWAGHVPRFEWWAEAEG